MFHTLKADKILRLWSTPFLRMSSTSGNKGLILGVYSDAEGDKLELTPTAEKFNSETNGKLLEHVKLSVLL